MVHRIGRILTSSQILNTSLLFLGPVVSLHGSIDTFLHLQWLSGILKSHYKVKVLWSPNNLCTRWVRKTNLIVRGGRILFTVCKSTRRCIHGLKRNNTDFYHLSLPIYVLLFIEIPVDARRSYFLQDIFVHRG